jgi:hypothetical protein
VTSRDTQYLLNQPFPFEEVLLSPKERSRVQKGPGVGQLFQAAPERLEVTEYRLRELSVRLRTINNACDSQASLPDGLPITEVSLYGSRDRQYVVGPYAAVKRLMAGDWPSKKPLQELLQRDLRFFESITHSLGVNLERVRNGERVMSVDLSTLLRPRWEVPRVGERTSFAVKKVDWPLVQFAAEDTDALESAVAKLKEIQSRPLPPLEEVKAWKHWWLAWTEGDSITSRWQAVVQSVADETQDVLAELQERVFAPG